MKTDLECLDIFKSTVVPLGTLAVSCNIKNRTRGLVQMGSGINCPISNHKGDKHVNYKATSNSANWSLSFYLVLDRIWRGIMSQLFFSPAALCPLEKSSNYINVSMFTYKKYCQESS